MDVFSTQINVKTTKPILFIATANSKEELSSIFVRLFLECQQVGRNLNKINREKLFKWILKRDSVEIDNTLIKKIVDLTSGFNYANYMTLLLQSTKYILKSELLETNWLIHMFIFFKVSSKFI